MRENILQGKTVEKEYPHWVMTIAFGMICAGILPMPLVYLLRRFQVLKVDLDIHQGSIRRNETTASTKEMIDQDDDVSSFPHTLTFISICVFLSPLSLSHPQFNILSTIFEFCHASRYLFLFERKLRLSFTRERASIHFPTSFPPPPPSQ
jgi:hypothetical protein